MLHTLCSITLYRHARVGQTFIDGFRVPKSFGTEHIVGGIFMPNQRLLSQNLIGGLLGR